MSIEINPCKACNRKYGNSLQNMNNCVYSIAAAFLGVQDVDNVLSSEYGSHCKECMDKVMIANGKDPCKYTKILQPPPIFVETPHYFPEELRKISTSSTNMKEAVNEAYRKCIEKCEDITGECAEACRMDASSVVIESSIPHPKSREGVLSPKSTEKKPSMLYWIVFSVILFLILVTTILLMVKK